MPLLLLLILLPLIEIGLFVVIGGRIGVWPVLSLIVLGALAGILLLRGRMARLPVLLRAGREPAQLLAGGVLTALGAFLLILPGFVTDILGLVLLLPPLQAWLGRRLAQAEMQAEMRSGMRPGGPRGPGSADTVIEGEFSVMEGGANGRQRDREAQEPPGRLVQPPRHRRPGDH